LVPPLSLRNPLCLVNYYLSVTDFAKTHKRTEPMLLRRTAKLTLWLASVEMWSAVAAIAAPAPPAPQAALFESFVDLPSARQNAILGEIVGNGCVVKTATFRGLQDTDTALWRVDCTDGQKYDVEIHPDEEDHPTLVENCLRE
jgi:hypothetical protein